eukprot:COSAG06_NODE_25240_length_641_cov_1.852399_1_plen_87_part_10
MVGHRHPFRPILLLCSLACCTACSIVCSVGCSVDPTIVAKLSRSVLTSPTSAARLAPHPNRKRDLPQLRALDPMPVLGDVGVVSYIL